MSFIVKLNEEPISKLLDANYQFSLKEETLHTRIFTGYVFMIVSIYQQNFEFSRTKYLHICV